MVPQIIFLIWVAFELGAGAAMNGRTRKDTNHRFTSTLFSVAIVLFFMWWCGGLDPLFN